MRPYLNRELRVEDIKVFDPACGSGNILVYVFDVLYEIYQQCGYLEDDIPKLIIEKNLYGLDIDDRAYQLACFSLVMKATSFQKRFLNIIKNDKVKLNVASIQESNILMDNEMQYLAGGEEEGQLYDTVKSFIDMFRDAKVYGSLIKVEDFNKEIIWGRLNAISQTPADNVFLNESREKLIRLIPDLVFQAEIMNGIYDVLITNPPYMGNKYMCGNLGEFVKKYYPETKSDLFSAFLEYCPTKVHKNGHLGFVTPFVWMFISSYENLREMLIENTTFSSLIQLEYNAFEAACVPVCTFTLRNYSINLSGEFVKLSDFTGIENQSIKTLEAIDNPNVYYRYTALSSEFNKISGSPIAYWVSNRVRKILEDATPLGEIAEPKQGMATTENKRFFRRWYELDIKKIGFAIESRLHAKKSGIKWFPYNKGGEFRKWYGNNEYVVNWENDGFEIKDCVKEKYKKTDYAKDFDEDKWERLIEIWVVKNQNSYFKQSITWSKISSMNFGVRYSPQGFAFDTGGSCVFPPDKDIYLITAFLCSKLTFEFLKIQNPTMNFQVGNIARLPILVTNKENVLQRIDVLSKENIAKSKQDWDSFETSWDFQTHPLLKYKRETSSPEHAFLTWSNFAENQFTQLKANEEELNRIFIDIYGLQDELTPEVEDKDITVRKADQERDIKSFLSYAVGCMLGRYSLDEEGLIFAGGKFNPERYKTYKADTDGILPVISDAYYEDDIVTQFVGFVKVTFGENTLATNLDYIAETLGRKLNESSRECIRRYFLKDFYKDHVQIYKKRPIYWLFTSGREQGFNALVYMHRYDSSVVSRVRTDYLHPLQNKLEAEFLRLNQVLVSEDLPTEKTKATKRLKVLTKQIDELKKYDEVIHNLADQQIEIDLDDGVVVNYAKFEKVLAKI